MVWCSSKLWRWWPRLAVSGSFKLFGSELLWCIYITGPEPREATRLQLENKKEGLVAHLSATLCVHGDLDLYRYHISSVCLLVCLASQIFFKNLCNMFGFLKSLSHKMSFLPLFCATIGKGNNRVKPTIAGCLSGGWWHWWHRSRIAKLGPDPLRQDADKEVVWLSMQANPIP
jgi:hypothetical protein